MYVQRYPEAMQNEVPAGFYAEAHEIYSDAQEGNVLAVVPLGADSLRFPAKA